MKSPFASKVFILFVSISMIRKSKAEQKCLNSEGKLLPSADSCTDILGSADCHSKFGAGLSANVRPAGTRPTSAELTECEEPKNILYAHKCRYTCATCCELPEHSCEDDKATLFDCSANRKMCKTMKTTMIKLCPATCGFCLEIDNSDPTCVDTIPNCKNDYEPFGFCKNSLYLEDMKANCAKTCNLCEKKKDPAQTVKQQDPKPSAASYTGDQAINCKDNEYLCDSPATEYRKLMLEQCAQTCKQYLANKISEKSSNDCFDESTHCAVWAQNNFCNNKFYSSQQVKKECAKTCAFC